LLSALYSAQDNREALKVCQKARALYAYDPVLPETLASIHERIQSKENALRKAGRTMEEVEVQLRAGAIRFRQYP
jgi:hypothetical protein